MSRGRGRLSRSSWVGVVSSSSMISLQRSMHSSQMYTPGPAISFLTCRWLFPQKLQRSCSLPSLALATLSPFTPELPFRLPVRHDVVHDSVLVSLAGVQVIVAFHVLRNLFHRLVRVLGDDLLQPPLEIDRLPGLDLDVRALALEAAGHLVDEDLGVRQRGALSLRARRKKERTHRHRDADASRG